MELRNNHFAGALGMLAGIGAGGLIYSDYASAARGATATLWRLAESGVTGTGDLLGACILAGGFFAAGLLVLFLGNDDEEDDTLVLRHVGGDD